MVDHQGRRREFDSHRLLEQSGQTFATDRRGPRKQFGRGLKFCRGPGSVYRKAIYYGGLPESNGNPYRAFQNPGFEGVQAEEEHGTACEDCEDKGQRNRSHEDPIGGE